MFEQEGMLDSYTVGEEKQVAKHVTRPTVSLQNIELLP